MKDSIKHLTYGHYIISSLKSADELKTRDRDYLAAGAVNWVSQISFDPAMLMVAIEQLSDLNETMDYSGKFSLHLLNQGQEDLLEPFSSKSNFEDGKVNGLAFQKENGFLHLDKLDARIDCEVEKSFNAGDHTIYIAKVVGQTNVDLDALCTKETAIQYSNA
jgi:flavin reductase (DIM6/NTAB) family NADH-FMN oxidoreductase RutF